MSEAHNGQPGFTHIPHNLSSRLQNIEIHFGYHISLAPQGSISDNYFEYLRNVSFSLVHFLVDNRSRLIGGLVHNSTFDETHIYPPPYLPYYCKVHSIVNLSNNWSSFTLDIDIDYLGADGVTDFIKCQYTHTVQESKKYIYSPRSNGTFTILSYPHPRINYFHNN